MFNLIISLIPSGIALSYFIYSIKNRKKIKNIYRSLLNGEVCYKCKSNLSLSSDEMINNTFDNKEHISLCRSCERDLKLNGLLNKKRKLIENINTKIISKKVFSRVISISLIIMTILVVITILNLMFSMNLKFPNYLLNIFLTIYWIFLIYRERLVTIKTKRTD